MLGARVPLLDSHAASNQPHRRHACMDASIMRALSSNMEFCGAVKLKFHDDEKHFRY
ncbi:hypothetical protein BDA96_09G017300 [Sorghum bicolor]|uniref:Uncharacterized protein n=2 Tax=Sorghum bicolor TaxID=4558 RepID=A0A921Q7T2_SORBI|nr:hypothetical protein BDA96_09G017300 [Sorghum bicolor]OQU77250.1 hypothetical protein SORBI_3009G016666 [Sorghum bicolor]